MPNHSNQLKLKDNSYTLNIITISLLLSISILFIINFFHIININSDASATQQSSSASATATVNLATNISTPVLSSDEIALALEPTGSSSDFKTGSTTVDVSTNNQTGYTLTISTNSSTVNALENEDESISAEIGALSGATTLTNFQSTSHAASMNKWGFTTNNNGDGDGQITANTYLPVATSGSPTTIKVTDGAANSSTTAVTFASKVNNSTPAGRYSNTVQFTATTNAVPFTGTLADITSMQDENIADACANTSTWSSASDDYTLTDSRDNKTYTVRKLSDGNCWMTQNLYLMNKTLTADDSDISSGSFTVPASSTDWGTSATVNTAKTYDTGNSSYGAYYNWYTATAGTGTSSTGANVNASSSICPKGWRLPKNSGSDNASTNELTAMMVAGGYTAGSYSMDVSTSTSAPLSLVFSGFFGSGSAGDQGVYGFWWSSTANNTSSARGLYVVSGGDVYPDSSDGKYYGDSVRCLVAAS